MIYAKIVKGKALKLVFLLGIACFATVSLAFILQFLNISLHSWIYVPIFITEYRIISRFAMRVRLKSNREEWFLFLFGFLFCATYLSGVILSKAQILEVNDRINILFAAVGGAFNRIHFA